MRIERWDRAEAGFPDERWWGRGPDLMQGGKKVSTGSWVVQGTLLSLALHGGFPGAPLFLL